MLTTLRCALAAVATAAAAAGFLAAGAAPASAAAPALDRPVAYVRAGNVYVSTGSTETRLGDGNRPRWSPDHKRIAFLRSGLLWVMNADGSAKRQLSDRPAAGPAWSADGRWIAFAAVGCTGGPVVYRIAAAGGAPEALFPAECRGEELPAVEPPLPPATGSLPERLRFDDALAWSPDGTRIAFNGGMCESTYDDCLTVGTVATGGEKTVAAYGGGGVEYSGFAVVPAFSPDGAALSWTAYRDGEAVHVVEKNLSSNAVRTIGTGEDRELVYAGAGKALLTGQYNGSSWLFTVDLKTGARTPFKAGSQPSA